MTTILALDPGPVKTAWVMLNESGILEKDYQDNITVRHRVALCMDTVAIEMIASYGMSVGAEVFQTCVHIGRFLELAPDAICVYRQDVKMHLCGQVRAKDSNVRQRIVDLYTGADMKKPTKKGGPLYGISGDVWAALAVAITARDLGDKLDTFKKKGMT